MKEYLDHNDKINSIRLELRHPNGKNTIWILVEGQSDIKIFKKLFTASNISVEQVHGGVECLRKAVGCLANETDRVIGIRDADFLHIRRKKETVKNLFLSDYHDIEMMMVHSDQSYRAIFAEYCHKELHVCFDMRRKFLNSIKFLGGVRLYNDINNHELNFKGLSINCFYDCESLSLDRNICTTNINQRSPHRKQDIDIRTIDNLIKGIDDLYNLCCGHDLMKVMAYYISSKQNRGINVEDLASCFRTSYSIDEFIKTKLFSSLSRWERRSGYSLYAEKTSKHRMVKAAQGLQHAQRSKSVQA